VTLRKVINDNAGVPGCVCVCVCMCVCVCVCVCVIEIIWYVCVRVSVEKCTLSRVGLFNIL
jgi:hypothetical protein